MSKFIGEKKVKKTEETKEKTPGGHTLIRVEFENGEVELFSSLLFDKIISDKTCDDSTLRDKRIFPVVQEVLVILREWGIKVGELSYLSAVLNQSLDFNSKKAITELFSKWMPRPNSPEDVDLVTIDRILRSQKPTLKDVIGGDK